MVSIVCCWLALYKYGSCVAPWVSQTLKTICMAQMHSLYGYSATVWDKLEKLMIKVPILDEEYVE